VNVVRDPLKQHRPLKSLSLPGRLGPKAIAPGWVSIIYKDFLKAANENLDDLVPSRWEYRWSTPTQGATVLATLAAVTHGEGVTELLNGLTSQRCFGRLALMGGQPVWVRGVSEVTQLVLDIGQSNLPISAQFRIPS
jgi:hypothetical protein